MKRPYTGLRVVEVGDRLGAAYGARLLADLGADVVKIEPPSGSSVRRYGPFPDGTHDPESSGLFILLNAGKRSVVLDLSAAEPRESLRALIGTADVLVTGLRRAALDEIGLTDASLSAGHPTLIMAAVTAFGLTGPYRDFEGSELVTAAFSGVVRRIGHPDREPLTLPLAQAAYQAGLAAASGITCALLSRRRSGQGQVVDVSEAEVFATVHAGFSVTRYQLAGHLERRAGHRFANQPYPQTVLPCKDGYVELNCPEGREWARFVEMIGSPEWTRNPRYANRTKNNVEYADELDALLLPWLGRHTRAEIFAMSRERHIACGPVRLVDEVLADEQLAEREFFCTVDVPGGKQITIPGFPARFSRTPAQVGGPAPRLGEHTAEVLAELR
ncbi:MAG: CoA transferase [Candidatus Rokubacteria bacterium]|nr:CoA transferase [Candidatus Rokubacteria bacterium]MBI3106143.1 CoA transferase [Candidatus Rokubacteria bacterium]